MKVLVTGASGFLGGAVVKALLEEGERDLRCLLRPGNAPGRLALLAPQYQGAEIEIMFGDLANANHADRAVADVDVIYHLAAGMRGAPADIFRNSVVASQRLVDAIERSARPVKVILVSSVSVYGAADLPSGAVITEHTPVEPHPEKRDIYSHAKLWQERVFWEGRRRARFLMVVVRPGVIYGAEGAPLPARIGMEVFGVFLNLGGTNPLPLTFVENCAAAVVLAGRRGAEGEIYNICDDDPPTCGEYLTRYRREVRKLRTMRVPYVLLYQISKLLERYVHWSEGQLPPVFTPYKVSTMWKGVRFDNAKLKRLGWKPPVPTYEALSRTFSELRRSMAPAG
jgi:nucleoside-diphosphate-sugar epimerase